MKFRFPIKTIADRMGIDRGNLSAYLSCNKPISERFIQRFYHTFAEELKTTVAKDFMPVVFALAEDCIPYVTSRLENLYREIEQLKILIDNLTRNLQNLIESNRILADSNQKLVETHVLLIDKKVDKT